MWNRGKSTNESINGMVEVGLEQENKQKVK
jgi:hypothetical protein